MGSLARWARRIAVGLALLGIATAGAAWWLIESLDLKRVVARVESALQDITGRAVTIGSEPQLQLTPLLKLVVRDVTLGNMDGGARAEMLRLDRLEIGVTLAPLLKGRRPGLNIALIEPDLLLEVGKQGERNWDLKLSWNEALALLKEAVAILEGKISLESVSIEGATVHFEDRRDGRKMALSARRAVLRLKNEDDYELEVDARLDGQAVEIHAGFQVPAPGELVPVRVRASLPGANLSAEGSVRPAWPAPGTDVKVALEIVDGAALRGLLGFKRGRFPPGRLDARLQGTGEGMRADPLSLAIGSSSLSGALELARFEPRPLIRTTLEAPVLDLGELLEATDAAGGARTANPADGRVFPATKFPMVMLHSLDMEAQLKAGRVIMPSRRVLEGLQAHLSLANGRLRVEPLAFATGGGQASGRLRLDAAAAKTATLEAEIQVKGIELDHLFVFAGLEPGQIKGARTDMAIKVTTNGDSVRTWMAGLDGHARVVVGEGRQTAKAGHAGGSVIGQAVDVANPYGADEGGSTIKCVVVNVPVRRGVVAIKDTVAAETDKVAGAVTGTVDLGQERLDLILNSQSVRGIGLADFASAAKLTGTLAKPELGVNTQGAAVAGLRIGAAIATGGVTLIAGTLARRSMPMHPCAAALAKAP